MSAENEKYARVTIRGELTCLADLHTGSGELGVRNNSSDGKNITVNELVYDCSQRPIITAASLRGYLHAQLNEDDANRIPLFGNANNEDDTGQAGALRLYDCRLNRADEWQEERRSRVAIDPITRTAKDKQLFNDLLIPKGSKFTVEMVLDNSNKAALNTLLTTLASLNANNPTAQLGQGKSHGRGNIEWHCTEIKALNHNALQNWLLKPDSPLKEADWEIINDQTIPPQKSRWQQLKLRYCLDTPLLINDSTIVEAGENQPDLRFMRRGDELLIPGSSIKGMFRARARRILMTISQGNNKESDKLLSKMFGAEEQAGIIRFYDATAPYKGAIHQQTMIAIDRFTGGVKDGAMLEVEAAKPEYATSTIALSEKIEPWQQALWLYCLRDAMEGDLALGWGQARGFGAFHLLAKPDSSEHFCNWENYLNHLDSDLLNEWVDDLENKLEECLA